MAVFLRPDRLPSTKISTARTTAAADAARMILVRWLTTLPSTPVWMARRLCSISSRVTFCGGVPLIDFRSRPLGPLARSLLLRLAVHVRGLNAAERERDHEAADDQRYQVRDD